MALGTNRRVSFHYLTHGFDFSNRGRLKVFLEQQLKKERKVIEALTYIFCSDAYLLSVNQQFLKHDYYTDIITFELSSSNHPVVADIYISIDRVKDNAILYRIPFTLEFHRVIFHGALHLAGFNDKNNKQAKLMRFKEDEWLRAYLFHVKSKNKINTFPVKR